MNDKKSKIGERLCNKCGESCWLPKDPKDGLLDPYGAIDIEVSAGYYSEHLFDPYTYSFSLCERCLADLFATFKLPVKVCDYLNQKFVSPKNSKDYFITSEQKTIKDIIE